MSTAADNSQLIRTPDRDMVQVSHEVLARNSRSFSWAARFLPADCRDHAAVVYAICRLVDDAADEAPSDRRARAQLNQLRAELDGEAEARPLVETFLEVADRRRIPVDALRELITGVESDLGEVIVADDGELLRYCYRVAGTVGLMMAPLLGVDDPRATAHAIDLGVAMQLTNICRDVLEDAERGRVYLPADRRRAVGVEPHALLEGRADPEAVAAVVDQLLDLADQYYRSADAGMHYIPARTRLAIVVASRIYRAIGVHLRWNGSDAMAGRTIVGPLAKCLWVLVALWAFLSPTVMGLTAPDAHDAELHEPLRGLPGASEKSSPNPLISN